MTRPELAEDERYAKMADRCARMEEVDELVNLWTREREKAEIFAVTQQHGVICAPVQNLDDVVNDEHMLARRSLERRNHPGLGEISQCQTPIRFRDFEPPPLTDVPALGADTDRVYGELAGITDDELGELRKRGVIL